MYISKVLDQFASLYTRLCCNQVRIILYLFFGFKVVKLIIMFNNDSYEFIKHFRHACQCYYDICPITTKKEMLIKAWSGPIFSICHPNDWDVFKSVTLIVMNPPMIRTPPGWPRTKRIFSAGKRRKRQDQVCSICRQLSHNRVKCTNRVPLGGVFTFGCESSRQQGIRKQKLCLVCKQLERTQNTCRVSPLTINEYKENISSSKLEF